MNKPRTTSAVDPGLQDSNRTIPQPKNSIVRLLADHLTIISLRAYAFRQSPYLDEIRIYANFSRTHVFSPPQSVSINQFCDVSLGQFYIANFKRPGYRYRFFILRILLLDITSLIQNSIKQMILRAKHVHNSLAGTTVHFLSLSVHTFTAFCFHRRSLSFD